MGTIVLDYGQMKSAERNAKKAANDCEEYANKIDSGVLKKIDSLSGGSSTNTSNASYFAQKKIADLREKNSKYMDFMHKLQGAREYAQNQDKQTSAELRNEGRMFRKNNGMSTNIVMEFLVGLSVARDNSTALGRLVSAVKRDIKSWVEDKVRDFKRWYELDGGKYIIKMVVIGVLAVAAALTLIFSAIPALVAAIIGLASISAGAIAAVIVAAAGVVTAIITLANQVTHLVSTASAYRDNNQDPAWAKRSSKISSVSDYFRKTRFKSGAMNKASYVVAKVYDGVSFVASTITFVNFAKGVSNHIGDLSNKYKHGGWSNVFDKYKFRSADTGKITLKSLYSGIKGEITRFNIGRKSTSFDYVMWDVGKMFPDINGIGKIKQYTGYVNIGIDMFTGTLTRAGYLGLTVSQTIGKGFMKYVVGFSKTATYVSHGVHTINSVFSS